MRHYELQDGVVVTETHRQMILGQILRDQHLLALRDVEQQQLLAHLDLLQQHLDEDHAANKSTREHGLEPVEDLPLFFRA